MFRAALGSILLGGITISGCRDTSPPPPRVAVPLDASEGPLRRSDPQKSMPGTAPRSGEYSSADGIAPAFDDPALISQEIPEKAAFVAAYNAVGRPLLIVEGVNRSDSLSTGADRPLAIVFSDWLRADGAVSIVTARGERAKPDVVIELSVNDDAGARSAVNLSARAINVADNVLLGQAMVDMPKPADRGAINNYTRFLARKLMNDITRTWQSTPPPAAAAPAEQPTPALPGRLEVPPSAPLEAPRDSAAPPPAPASRPGE